MEHKKRGRKPSMNAKRSIIAVRLAEEQYNAIKKAASSHGVSPSVFVRETLLKSMEQEGMATSLPSVDPSQLSIPD